MARRIGHYTLQFERPPRILSWASAVGPKEGEGPLGKEFDRVFTDPYLGKETWEAAESELQRQVFSMALRKAELTPDRVQCLFAGDLLNQCIGSTEGLGSFGVPHAGMYGACSTMALSLLMASCMVEGGLADCAGAVTSSHFCSSERQFRQPLEYGGQRPQTAGWTATAAGAVLVGTPESGIRVQGGILGRLRPSGITDANNMGAAMAPAAVETVLSYLHDTHTAPQDYDRIITGDLGEVGSKLMRELAAREGVDLASVHSDCGLNLYNTKTQDIHAGGSGCGCSASVLCSRILRQLTEGELHRVLFVATGSLHSPTSIQQGVPITAIAHGVLLES